MRMEIPAWVAVVVIVVVLLITAFVLWRGTSVQKQDLPPEQLPGGDDEKSMVRLGLCQVSHHNLRGEGNEIPTAMAAHSHPYGGDFVFADDFGQRMDSLPPVSLPPAICWLLLPPDEQIRS